MESWRMRCAGTLVALALSSGQAHSAGSPAPVAGARNAAACHDFFDYVNRRWLAATTIPNDRSAWGEFAEIAKRNEAIVHAALRDLNTTESLSPANRKLLDIYRIGMDTAAIERVGTAPLGALLARIDAMTSTAQLPEVLATLHRAGISAGHGLAIAQDPGDSGRYIVTLTQDGLGLPDRDFYTNDDAKSRKLRVQYLAHVRLMLGYLGRSADAAARDAKQIMALETRLAGASKTQVERRDPVANYHRMAPDALSARAPQFDWSRYLRSVGIAEAGELNVAQPEFMADFARAAAEVPLPVWQRYLAWHVLNGLAPYLERRVEQADFRFFHTVLEGKREPRPRDRRVIDAIGGHYGELPMGQVVGALYVERAFSPRAKQRAEAMVDNIRAVLRERIETLAWMSEHTRQEALKKLDAMRVKIGYPDKPLEVAALNVDPQGYALNMMRIAEFDLQRRIDRLGSPVDRDEWTMGAYIVNAYYDAQMNEIVFPAGILQPTFFDVDGDDAANYGATGSTIGHEIIHGFDDEGRQYDAAGNLRDWWTAEDAANYNALAEDIVKQYERFVVIDGKRLNGRLTLGENIADIGGLRIAYEAYRRARAAQADTQADAKTDDLEADRRFFEAYAESWREKRRAEIERLWLAVDPHSPPRFRTVGALAHMPEFSRAYGCSAPARGQRFRGIW